MLMMALADTRLEVVRKLAPENPEIAELNEEKARLMEETDAPVMFAGMLPVAVTRDHCVSSVVTFPEMNATEEDAPYVTLSPTPMLPVCAMLNTALPEVIVTVEEPVSRFVAVD
jgi:hypothetical protein